jgi:hypothetical protein
MCDTDLARIGDLRCRQCNAITEDNCLLFFGPCTAIGSTILTTACEIIKKRCECV